MIQIHAAVFIAATAVAAPTGVGRNPVYQALQTERSQAIAAAKSLIETFGAGSAEVKAGWNLHMLAQVKYGSRIAEWQMALILSWNLEKPYYRTSLSETSDAAEAFLRFSRDKTGRPFSGLRSMVSDFQIQDWFQYLKTEYRRSDPAARDLIMDELEALSWPDFGDAGRRALAAGAHGIECAEESRYRDGDYDISRCAGESQPIACYEEIIELCRAQGTQEPFRRSRRFYTGACVGNRWQCR